MGKFIYHPDAKEDIQTLGVLYPGEMLRLGALLRQLTADPAKFAKIWEDGYGEFRCDDFNVLEWRTAQKQGADLWRLKDLGLERDGKLFRVFYCMHENVPDCAHILAVIYKHDDNEEFDYDDLTSPDAARMLRAYNAVRTRR